MFDLQLYTSSLANLCLLGHLATLATLQIFGINRIPLLVHFEVF